MLNWRDPKNPKSGGAEVVTMEYAKRWTLHGHNIVWFTSAFNNASPEEKIEGVKIIRRGNSVTVYIFALFFYLFSGIKFDLVIDQIHGLPFFTPLYSRVPIIAYVHEVAGEIWDYMYPFPINVIGKFFETFYFPIYKKIPFWTNSPSTVEDLEKNGISSKNCTVIICGNSSAVLNNLPKKEDEITYIFVSRVVRMKGIEEILKAFGFIHKENPSALLWIVGNGDKEYVQKLKKMTKDYNIEKNVVFWGNTSDKQKFSLMKRAHVLLHASVKEGWGLVVIEAASQGTPSVVYNVSGLKNSVKDGRTGVVLRANTPQEMARQALLLVRDTKRYMSMQKNGLIWARSLTWENATQKSLDLIEKVAHE
jgi:glycosyltransferase involved in cell wall biosynthesis